MHANMSAIKYKCYNQDFLIKFEKLEKVIVDNTCDLNFAIETDNPTL